MPPHGPNSPTLPPETLFPRHGTTQFFTTEERVARLKLNTVSGSNYFIKIAMAGSKKKLAIFYLEGGRPFETKLPLGTYEIFYATGRTWYGNKAKFGPQMNVAKFDSPMTFRSEGNYVVGMEIQFEKVMNGNLHSTGASPEDLE